MHHTRFLEEYSDPRYGTAKVNYSQEGGRNEFPYPDIRGIASEPSAKYLDPRYVPGRSAVDDDMTDAQWLDAMGPHHSRPVPADELGLVCEGCLVHLPNARMVPGSPPILCDGCKGGSTSECKAANTSNTTNTRNASKAGFR